MRAVIYITILSLLLILSVTEENQILSQHRLFVAKSQPRPATDNKEVKFVKN
jgi:hypothetical protein